MNPLPNIKISAPISPFWNLIDNQAVRWLNRKAEWLIPVVAAGAYAAGSVTLSKAAVIILAGKVIGTVIHFLGHYAEVSRIQSTFQMTAIQALKGKVENQTASDEEKYQLANLLFQRALQFDENHLLIKASGGHANRSSVYGDFGMLLKNEAYAFFLDRWINKDDNYIPVKAWNEDLKAAQALYQEVRYSQNPQTSDALKADAIYHYLYMAAIGYTQIPGSSSSMERLNNCERDFNLLSDQGQYAPQMKHLVTLFRASLPLAPLQRISWYHPREILENRDILGTPAFSQLSDICPTCSKAG